MLSACQCIYLKALNDNDWGTFQINSNDVKHNNTDCIMIFVSGKSNEIVELRLLDIELRDR